MKLYEAMNEKIADIIAIDGTPSALYASAYIKDLRAETARLNAEISRLNTELAHREEDLVHADEKVFYREIAVKLDEDKIKKQAVKEFAGKMKAEINSLLSVEFIGKTRKQVYQRKGMDEGLQTANEILDDLITELYGADE